MKTKSIAIISCLILFFGAAMTVSAQNGKFGVVGLRFYQESRDRFSFDGETNFVKPMVYFSICAIIIHFDELWWSPQLKSEVLD